MHSPLPDNWIDALFARLTGLYGNRFTNMWANIDATLIRKTWATELAGIPPAGIKYALEHLPAEFPPTALQFKQICCMRPDDTPALSNNVVAHPTVRKAVIEGLKPHEPAHWKAWAETLRRRHVACEKLNANQIRCYRAALGMDKVAA